MGEKGVYDHRRIKRFQDEDKDFEINFTVKKVWKEFDDEVDSHRPDPVIQSISTVKDTVRNVEKETN